jgi:carboxypeptidase family protein
MTTMEAKTSAIRAIWFCFVTLIALCCCAFGQSTVGTGSITGTVTDPSGAVVAGAKVTVTNTGTGQTINLTSNSAGAFNAAALAPGNYKVQVTATNFSTVDVPVTVQVGNTATANIKMQLGQESQVIEVQASEVQVNTEQAIVQGVLTANQIENLPVNGRNFLDLAQLEPGVQIQDGQNFDPTKAGYSSISFGGRFGRTARISVDGVDVSDETVGTTTADIPASAIQEFQLSQSSLDLSQDLSSSGAVNVTTRSGTNAFHGEGFGFFRDSSMAANLPVTPGFKAPFQRSQFGGRFGGPLIKDKLFFFLDAERTKQDSTAPVSVGAPLDSSSGTFTQPFRETNVIGKADYQLTKSAHLFYRFNYFSNLLAATFGFGYSVYDNKDITHNHVVGLDWNTGSFTHSVRFSYLKFQNQIKDATEGSSLPFADFPSAASPVEVRILPSFYGGPNPLAPQSTPQSNHQIKYDGSKSIHSHVFRYGISYNHIQGGGFADFFGLAPRVTAHTGASDIAFAETGPFPGGASNPLNFPVFSVAAGNGQGFNTENPAFGFPAGGLGPDNRIGLYVGDSWKVKPNFTLNFGLRYDRDTNRTDSDLPAIPEINAAFPGLGNPVRQPNTNFAPQGGFAWDPKGDGKTVIRGGIGLFYENVIFNNVLFDRPLRLRDGAFNQTVTVCLNGAAFPLETTAGVITAPVGACSDAAGKQVPIGSAAPLIAAFGQLYQSLNPFSLSTPNPNFVGTQLADGVSLPTGLFAPNYRSPRSLQMNIGIQHEIRPGMVLSADYLRNITTHTLLGIDVNKVGDVSRFNPAVAAGAINATNAGFGCGPGQTGVNCAIAAGATIEDYAFSGLTSPGEIGGACNSSNGLGVPCAFDGLNPNQGAMPFLFPIGRSLYNGLQMKLTQNVNHPMRGLHALNLQAAYSLSRFENSGGAQATGLASDSDQDFVINAVDNNQPNKFFGPSLLDRTHQFSFGGFADVPAGFRLSVITHFYSPLPNTLTVQNTGSFGQIFQTDFTGDGSTQDLMPGTTLGNFDRGINASQLNNVITNYNNTVAGNPTPAGQAVINAGLMTAAQLKSLGGVAPTVALAPAGQVNMDWLRATDLKIAWRHTFQERFTVEPSVGIFNVFNFANFNLPPNTMSGLLSGSQGTINGTNYAGAFINRVGNGTGVYSLGSPRQLEFGLQLTF